MWVSIKDNTLSIAVPFLAVVVYFFGIIVFPVCYAISLSLEQIKAPSVFLSSAIREPPASAVASFIISPGSLLFALLGLVRYLQVESEMPKTWINRIGLLLSCLCGIGGHGVASWPTRSNKYVHTSFAILYFASGAFFLVVTVIIDHKCKSFVKPLPRLFRVLSCILCFLIASALGLLMLYGVELLEYPVFCDFEFAADCIENFSEYKEAKQEVKDIEYVNKLVAVGLEIAVFYIFLTAFMTFAFEMYGLSLDFRVVDTSEG